MSTEDLPLFPERMKANKALVGRTCPTCGQAVALAENVWNCRECRGTMHEGCRDTAGGCAHPACATKRAEALPVAPDPAAPPPGAETKPCPHCGETILSAARKCRFCGERFDGLAFPSLEAARAEDEKLSGGEIAFGVLCGGIAFIVSLVWLFQGKKKAWKLLVLSVIMQMFWVMVRMGMRQ